MLRRALGTGRASACQGRQILKAVEVVGVVPEEPVPHPLINVHGVHLGELRAETAPRRIGRKQDTVEAEPTAVKLRKQPRGAKSGRQRRIRIDAVAAFYPCRKPKA